MNSRRMVKSSWLLFAFGLVLVLAAPHPAAAQTEPDTTITGFPVVLGLSRLDASTFTFASSMDGSTFECSLDGADFAGCNSPKNYPSLANGSHTFQVRAVYGGVPDSSPAGHTWTVSQYEQWSREVLGNPSADYYSMPLGSAIALDSQGNMRAVYATRRDVVYAAWDPTTRAWSIEVIDSVATNRTMGRWISLALDASDYPRITYYRDLDDAAPGLYYAAWDGTAWTTTLVDAAPDYSHPHGVYNSLALDAGGQPHIAYFNKFTTETGEMKYADWNSGTNRFDIQTASTTGGGCGLSLAVTASGVPRLGYCEYAVSASQLKYAVWNGSGWDAQTVDDLGNAGWLPSLRLDGSGYPRIGYLSYTGSPDTGYQLRYAAWNGTAWDRELVGSTPYGRLSLALDSAGHPHIGFMNTDYNPGYAAWDGQAWKTEQIVAKDTGEAAGSCTVVLDSYDRAHFSVDNASWETYVYEKALAGKLVATAVLSGHSYPIDAQLQVCLSGGTIGDTPSCQTATGNGGMVEWSELMPGSDYAVSGGTNADWSAPTPQTGLAVLTGETAQVTVGFEYTGSAGPDTVITGRPMFDRQNSSSDAAFQFEASQTECSLECSLDGANWATCTSPTAYPSLANGSHTFQVRAINYRDTVDSTPAAFTWTVNDAAAWQLAELGDAQDYVQGRIVFDGTGNPWAVYSIGDTSQGSSSYIAAWTGLTWDRRLFAEPAKQPILVFGDNGTKSVACISWSVWFDTWDGTRWTIENVPTDEEASGIDFKVDSTGKPHVAFIDDVMGDSNIKYATPGERDWQGNRSWNVELVGTGAGIQDPRPSLALDASDNPRLAWADTLGTVYYAVRSGGSWSVETVADVEHNYWPYAPLALGSDGRPRVAFCENYAAGGGSNLWYAERSDSGWNTEAVAHWAADGNCQAPSLALDADDHPHISVFNPVGGPEYFSWSGTAWERQVVESITSTDYESSTHLVLDAQGRPNIIFSSTGYTWRGEVIFARGPVEGAPIVTTQPDDQSVFAGEAASFTSGASGDPTLTVQWQVSTDGGSAWNDIPGATAGTHQFTASYAQNGYQYHAVFTNDLGSATSNAATLTVSKHAATVTLSNLAQTYDGQPKPAAVATDPAGLTVVVTYDGAETVPDDVGSYAVAATVDDPDYQGTASGSLTIAQRAASVTPDAASKVYGDADPALGGTLAGFVEDDGVTAAYSRASGEAVGSYTISAVLSPDEVLDNYDITYNTATFAISQRPIEVTADGKTKCVGDPDPELTYHISSGSLAFDDAFSGVLTRVPGEEIGTYAITQGTLALDGNYELAYTGADLTIMNANSAPIANPGGSYVGAANTAIQFDGSGSSDPEGDPLTYAWTFGDGSTGSGATPAHSYTAAGIYDLCLTVHDGSLDSDRVCSTVVVYDPSGGYVYGWGWILSPAGAYIPNPSLSGFASFGFVSRYMAGAKVPTGNTEFRFFTGNFSFRSTSYEWLVVDQAGMRAQYKGSGTVNSALAPNGKPYKFMLWAGDGNPGSLWPNPASPDTFRIRVWWEGAKKVENVVYDNGVDQAIAGGSIVVYTGK